MSESTNEEFAPIEPVVDTEESVEEPPEYQAVEGTFEEEPVEEPEEFHPIEPVWDEDPESEPEEFTPEPGVFEEESVEEPPEFTPIEGGGWGDEPSAAEPEVLTGVIAPEPGGPEGTIAEIKAWVGDDPERAQIALDTEAAKDDQRSTLLSWLEDVIHGR